MPLRHDTVLYDVNDARVYPLLTDAVGASPTYGAGIDVPGITAFSAEPNLVTAEKKGDARVIAKKGRTDRLNCSAEYGKLQTDVLKVLLSGTTGDTATTQHGYRLASPAPLPYFMFRAQVQDTDPGLGDVHAILWKCQLTGGSLIDLSSDEFNSPSFDFEAFAIEGDLPAGLNSITAATTGGMLDVVFHDVVTALLT